MPQMSPMNWSLMFIMFILIFILAMNMLYFMSPTQLMSKNIPNKNTLYNNEIATSWKW